MYVRLNFAKQNVLVQLVNMDMPLRWDLTKPLAFQGPHIQVCAWFCPSNCTVLPLQLHVSAPPVGVDLVPHTDGLICMQFSKRLSSVIMTIVKESVHK